LRAVCTSQHGEGVTARRPYKRRESLLAVIINARMPGVPGDGTCTSRQPASRREGPSRAPGVGALAVGCSVAMVMVSYLRTNGPWRLSAARGGGHNTRQQLDQTRGGAAMRRWYRFQPDRYQSIHGHRASHGAS